MAINNLDDLIEGITNAVVHAQQLTEQQHFDIIKRFFTLEQGSWVAKTAKVLVPSLESNGQTGVQVDVPLVTLVPLNSLTISEINVEFEASLSAIGSDKDKKKRMQMEVGGQGMFGAKKNNVKVNIKIKGTTPPEGLVKLNDHVLKHIP